MEDGEKSTCSTRQRRNRDDLVFKEDACEVVENHDEVLMQEEIHKTEKKHKTLMSMLIEHARQNKTHTLDIKDIKDMKRDGIYRTEDNT